MCSRVDLQQIESTGYELIREGMKVLEEEVGKACNRETIAKSKLTKLMTITSEDFELNTEIIGTSALMNSGDFFTLGRASLYFTLMNVITDYNSCIKTYLKNLTLIFL